MSAAVLDIATKTAQYRRRYLQFLSLLGLGVAFTLTPLLFMWGLDGAAISCLLYAPVSILVFWSAHRSDGKLGLFVNIFVFSTLLVTLGGIYFQEPDAITDPWILTCPVVSFALCRRQVAAAWTVLTLLALVALRHVAHFPSTPVTTALLALAVVAISIVLYVFSAHIEKSERLIVELGNTDSLTGTLNRRSFQETLEAEFRRDLRQSASMTVFMVDVDYFKPFNDRYGHLAGDETLVKVAGALKDAARRAGDHVFRYGGEEFCVLCSALDPAQAASFAEQLRATVAMLELPHEASPLGKLSVSVGYRHAEQLESLTPTTLVETADRALYQAKAKGRNRVESYIPALVSAAAA